MPPLTAVQPSVRKNPRIETGLRLTYTVLQSGFVCSQKEPQDRNWIETFTHLCTESVGAKVRKNPRIETGLRQELIFILFCSFECQKEPQDRNWIETSFLTDISQTG